MKRDTAAPFHHAHFLNQLFLTLLICNCARSLTSRLAGCLALAAAANSHGTLAFSLSSTITFVRASGPGDTLYAEAHERYIGRSTGCYQVDITNQNGDLIATFESSVFRKEQKVPFDIEKEK